MNELEPEPPQGDVVKPPVLSAGAGAIWDELAPICLAMRTLTPADVRAFRTLCEVQAGFDEAVAAKGTEDFRVRDFLDLANKLRPYYEYFGLTPASRARISVPKPKDDAPMSKWAGVLK